jgi:hypothetical protein
MGVDDIAGKDMYYRRAVKPAREIRIGVVWIHVTRTKLLAPAEAPDTIFSLCSQRTYTSAPALLYFEHVTPYRKEHTCTTHIRESS